MSDRLYLRTAQLDDTGTRLASVVTSLRGTAAFSAHMADAAGHAGLSAALILFAGQWQIAREDMVHAVQDAADALQKVRDEIGDTDDQLADALEAPPAAPASPATPHGAV